MYTPIQARAALALITASVTLMGFGGCVANSTTPPDHGLRSTFSGTRAKSLYEMAVSNEATRIRKGDPSLSQKEALARARRDISASDFGETETPQEQKARKLKEAQKKFAADLEKSMTP